LGAGSFPDLTHRHTVADEHPHKPSTIGWRTMALSGSSAKFLSAAGSWPDVVRPDLRDMRRIAVDGCFIS